MKVTEAFVGNFIDALCVTGSDAKLEIAGYDRPNTVKDASDKLIDKPILRFVGTDKGLILNKTNARTIGLSYGNEMDHWKGEAITLYSTTCEAFGDIVACVRVRPMNIYKSS